MLPAVILVAAFLNLCCRVHRVGRRKVALV
jgi:hypothetical protein